MLSRRIRGVHGLLLAAAALAPAAPAAAELPPYVYERARDAAVSVIVVDISRVTAPREAFDEAACTLEGKVAAVERGDLHAAGRPVAVDLPCVGSLYQPMPGPFPGYSAEALAKVTRGRLFLDAQGALVRRGFDALPARD
ncbi:hypothetical protein E2493_19160 [Sphingomonas parva]|uniref:Uncharacterized protein n=1 Tax=Sphingomonas parva TaxID=2555898 RepID=A0A4Y8ZMY8_9SPHN|nr:hypothetical protein [Sphingomonas parva]TFI56632.1 hypothetical protein E2493_19160 [Sphingomonas parva]